MPGVSSNWERRSTGCRRGRAGRLADERREGRWGRPPSPEEGTASEGQGIRPPRPVEAVSRETAVRSLAQIGPSALLYPPRPQRRPAAGAVLRDAGAGGRPAGDEQVGRGQEPLPPLRRGCGRRDYGGRGGGARLPWRRMGAGHFRPWWPARRAPSVRPAPVRPAPGAGRRFGPFLGPRALPGRYSVSVELSEHIMFISLLRALLFWWSYFGMLTVKYNNVLVPRYLELGGCYTSVRAGKSCEGSSGS